jgi:hypothetical protein
MFILAYFLKNENIASLVLNTPGAVSAITLCLQASELQTRKGAMELLYDISRTHPFAPQYVIFRCEKGLKRSHLLPNISQAYSAGSG